MELIHVFLCDDDPAARRNYSNLIEQIAANHQILVCLSLFAGGEELLAHIAEENLQPDIIYMDITMPSPNGLETAELLRRHGCEAELIFLTNAREHVFRAFDVAPLQYLLKETTGVQKFESVFLRAVSLCREKRADLFVCDSGNCRRLIPLRQISYFEIWKRVIMVHYNTGETFEFYGTMEHLEKRLADKKFIRVHRSYLVNLHYIAQYHPQSLLLRTGESIPIGITHTKQVKDVFYAYTDSLQLPEGTPHAAILPLAHSVLSEAQRL